MTSSVLTTRVVPAGTVAAEMAFVQNSANAEANRKSGVVIFIGCGADDCSASSALRNDPHIGLWPYANFPVPRLTGSAEPNWLSFSFSAGKGIQRTDMAPREEDLAIG